MKEAAARRDEMIPENTESTIDKKVDAMISEAKSLSHEHKRVFADVYDIYIKNVLKDYKGEDKINALRGIMHAVDSTSERVKRRVYMRTNTIEIDTAAKAAVLHPDRVKYLTEDLKKLQMDVINGEQMASMYGISDCLPPQFERIRKYGTPWPTNNDCKIIALNKG
ncbi:MAG: hypothetical protein NT001_03865 [Candidatus Woesearchaeota archaeon]|nr:hypothetical protein [Candidatus Woesearchaeota archaeon]